MSDNKKITPNEELDNILKGISIDLESEEEVDTYITDRNLDLTSFLGKVAETVESGYKAERLSWMVNARKKLESGLSQTSSWLDKSKEEIEHRVLEVLSGALGPAPKAAFRNFKEMSLEDKATLLDDLELMQQDDDENNTP